MTSTHQRATRVPRALTDLIDELWAMGDDLVFPDHSGTETSPDTQDGDTETDEDRQWVTLNDLRCKPTLCGNNCHAATSELHRAIIENIGLDQSITTTGTVELVFTTGVHWANTATLADGSMWVVDFTAQQFDSDVAMPLILPATTWVQWTANQITTQFGGDHTDTCWQ